MTVCGHCDQQRLRHHPPGVVFHAGWACEHAAQARPSLSWRAVTVVDCAGRMRSRVEATGLTPRRTSAATMGAAGSPWSQTLAGASCRCEGGADWQGDRLGCERCRRNPPPAPLEPCAVHRCGAGGEAMPQQVTRRRTLVGPHSRTRVGGDTYNNTQTQPLHGVSTRGPT